MATNDELQEKPNELSQPAATRPIRRRRRRDYDGEEPLDDPALETVAQFLSTPKHIRDIKTFTDLATHLDTSRMTIYRWSRDPDVLTRAEHLLEQNRATAVLDIKRNWDRIIRGQIRAAIKGDARAAKFCEERAWPTLNLLNLP